MFGVVHATLPREPPFADADRLAILINAISSFRSVRSLLRIVRAEPW
jgi:hypothetical protein